MKHFLIAFVAWFCATMFFAGCRRAVVTAPDQTVGRAIMAASNVATVENLKTVALAGAVLMTAGIVLLAFTSRKKSGAILAGGGAAMVCLYVQAAEFPLSAAILPMVAILGMTAVVVMYIYRGLKLQKATWLNEEMVKAIEPHPEVKAEIGGGDPDVQAELKTEITPIKNRLRQAGELILTPSEEEN